jgi:hypothetical protein
MKNTTADDVRLLFSPTAVAATIAADTTTQKLISLHFHSDIDEMAALFDGDADAAKAVIAGDIDDFAAPVSFSDVPNTVIGNA